ncbi:MAG: 2''-aminoglycoside nucleotidyltransferase [Firmicutes bacterium]|nr:2''-aminoglycoside nucleotidyltransferase [candidate division NPL-UPA2 bacterium]
MDKRRLRQLRAIAQLVEALDRHSVKAWLGGGWALEALDHNYQRDHSDVDFHVLAHDAPSVRVLLEELGYNIVEVTASSFAAERGKLRLDWELLWWEDEAIVTYDSYADATYVWPLGAFPPEKTGIINGVAVYVMSPSAQRQHKLDYDKKQKRLRQKDMKDLARLRSLIHDRL